MSDLKNQLIKLGDTNPELREAIRPILDALSAPKIAAPTLERQLDYRKVARVLAEVGSLVGMLDALLRKLEYREHKAVTVKALKAAKQYQMVLEDVLATQNELATASDRLRKRHHKAMADMVRYIKPFSHLGFDSLLDMDAYELVAGIERQFDKIERMDTRL